MQHYLPDMYFPGVSCIRVTTPGVCVVTVDHTVVWSATDSSGNTGTAWQRVTVTDTTPPRVFSAARRYG